MKTNYYSLLLAIIAFLIGLNIVMYNKNRNQLPLNHLTEPVIIWNDDPESIPMDNTPVLLEFGSKNSDTLYIGPLEQNPAEYQFVVTDDSITITDFSKKVGTIKLEGKLKKLINKDNL